MKEPQTQAFSLCIHCSSEEWAAIKAAAKADLRSIPGFFLATMREKIISLSVSPFEEALSPAKNKRSQKKKSADDDEEFTEENEEDIKPLYGGGFPDDVEEEIAEMRRSSVRKAKSKTKA